MIDKRLLTDTIQVKLIDDVDMWGKHTHQEPFTVNFVRFDRLTVDKTEKASKLTNTVRNRTGNIFIYPRFSKVKVNDSWLQAQITDEHGTYEVVSYQVNYFNGKVFSYEVNVI